MKMKLMISEIFVEKSFKFLALIWITMRMKLENS